MRLIDADALEKEGWSLHRTVRVDRHTSEYQVKPIADVPTIEPERNNHTVACLLADLFDDTCACNYSDIDEWLPEKCEVIDSCPNPGGVACWEQFLKHRSERRTDE